jgi:undecaprenyl-diphosphatase
MQIFQTIVLGIVQGLTEFLPISSDGHLILIRHLLHWQDQGLLFDAILHLGTFLAVLIYFRKVWARLLKTILKKGTRNDEILLGLLILATIPGALLGFFGKDFIEQYFRGAAAAGFGFLATAILLYFADKVSLKNKNRVARERLSFWQTIGVGVMQAVALLPGVSRSGSTISGGIFAGLSRESAVEFSFLMALPITGGAGLLALLKDFGQSGTNWPSLLAGFVFSFFVGLWAIGFLIKRISQRATFRPYVIYLIIIAIVSFVVAGI